MRPLFVADVDDHLWLRCNQRFHVQVRLAAVELSKCRQFPGVFRKVIQLIRTRGCGKAHQRFRCDGHEYHLRNGATRRSFRNDFRYFDLTPAIICKGNCADAFQRIVICPAVLPASGKQHRNGQYHGYCNSQYFAFQTPIHSSLFFHSAMNYLHFFISHSIIH